LLFFRQEEKAPVCLRRCKAYSYSVRNGERSIWGEERRKMGIRAEVLLKG
jgi:hypothetical protein